MPIQPAFLKTRVNMTDFSAYFIRLMPDLLPAVFLGPGALSRLKFEDLASGKRREIVLDGLSLVCILSNFMSSSLTMCIQ